MLSPRIWVVHALEKLYFSLIQNIWFVCAYHCWACVFSFFLRKVFSKNIDHKLELILTLCFHSHLNPSEEKSALPKKIPGSLPLKPGINYRRNQSSRSVKRTDRENQSTTPESKWAGKRTEAVITIQRGKRFLEPETTNIRVIDPTTQLCPRTRARLHAH